MSDPAVEAAEKAGGGLGPLRIAHEQMRKSAEGLDSRSAIRIGMTTVLDDLARFIYPTNTEDD